MNCDRLIAEFAMMVTVLLMGSSYPFRQGGARHHEPAALQRLALDNVAGALFWLISAFLRALHVERCAPFNARLGTLRRFVWTA